MTVVMTVVLMVVATGVKKADKMVDTKAVQMVATKAASRVVLRVA